MPKKVHGRQAKQKSRNRRSAAPAQSSSAAAVDELAPAAAATTTAAATAAARPTTPRPASAPRPGAARRSPTLTVNYAYLHHDLVSLGILGPAMIVLLIIAYLIFHGA